MSSSTEVAAKAASTEVAEREAALEALRQQQEQEFSNDSFQVPILKIGQALTKEVNDDNSPAQAGDFINTLTGEPYGRAIQFIIAYYQQGRTAADRKTGRYYVAFQDTIPEKWADLVGDSFVGTRFDEYPDAEEQFKAAVNSKQREWGNGPLVSTSHNFTGLVLASVRDEEDQVIEDEFELQPVRLSMVRTHVRAANKINQLKRMNLRPPKMFWSRVFDLRNEQVPFKSGPAFVPMPSLGRPTTPDEQEAATELALAVAAGRVTDNSDGDAAQDRAVEPDAKGGVAL